MPPARPPFRDPALTVPDDGASERARHRMGSAHAPRLTDGHRPDEHSHVIEHAQLIDDPNAGEERPTAMPQDSSDYALSVLDLANAASGAPPSPMSDFEAMMSFGEQPAAVVAAQADPRAKQRDERGEFGAFLDDLSETRERLFAASFQDFDDDNGEIPTVMPPDSVALEVEARVALLRKHAERDDATHGASIAISALPARIDLHDDDDAGQTIPAPPDYELQARKAKTLAMPSPARIPTVDPPKVDDLGNEPLSLDDLLQSEFPIHGDQPLVEPRFSQAREPDSSAPVASSRRGSFTRRSSVAPPPSARMRPRNSLEELRDLLALGDYTGALGVAELRLEEQPDEAESKAARNHCRATLKQMYSARIGSLERTPVLLVPPEQLRWMSIDQRAAFLLHHVDGLSSFETILDICGMPELDALRLLSELITQRIVEPR